VGRLDIGRHWLIHEFQTGQGDRGLSALRSRRRGLVKDVPCCTLEERNPANPYLSLTAACSAACSHVDGVTNSSKAFRLSSAPPFFERRDSTSYNALIRNAATAPAFHPCVRSWYSPPPPGPPHAAPVSTYCRIAAWGPGSRWQSPASRPRRPVSSEANHLR